MADYTKALSTSEVMDLDPDEKSEYIANRKYYRRWVTKKVCEQTLTGLGMIIISVVAPTGGSVIFLPLGIYLIICAKKRNIVIG